MTLFALFHVKSQLGVDCCLTVLTVTPIAGGAAAAVVLLLLFVVVSVIVYRRRRRQVFTLLW